MTGNRSQRRSRSNAKKRRELHASYRDGMRDLATVYAALVTTIPPNGESMGHSGPLHIDQLRRNLETHVFNRNVDAALDVIAASGLAQRDRRNGHLEWWNIPGRIGGNLETSDVELSEDGSRPAEQPGSTTSDHRRKRDGQCSASTQTGRPCQIRCEPGQSLCPFHWQRRHGPASQREDLREGEEMKACSRCGRWRACVQAQLDDKTSAWLCRGHDNVEGRRTGLADINDTESVGVDDPGVF